MALYAPVTSLSVIECIDAVSTPPATPNALYWSLTDSSLCAELSIGDHRFDEVVKERVKKPIPSFVWIGFTRTLFLCATPRSRRPPPFFYIPLFFNSPAPEHSFSIRSIFLVVDARHDASVRRRGVMCTPLTPGYSSPINPSHHRPAFF